MQTGSGGGGNGRPPKKKVVKKAVRKSPPPKSEAAAGSGYKKKPAPPTPTKGVTGSVAAGGKPAKGVSGKVVKKKPDPMAGDPLAPMLRVTRNAKTAKKPGLGKSILRAGQGLSNLIRRTQEATDVSRGGLSAMGYTNSTAERAARNLPKDFANVMVNTIPATVHLVDTAIKDQQDKVGRSGITRLGHELAAPYVELAKHPGKMAVEQPFSTAMLVTGPVRGASRGVGAVARRGALGKAAKRAAATERPAAKTSEPTRTVEPRRYSPDPVGKAIQVRVEKRKLKKIANANRRADELDTKGKHAEAAAVRQEAAQQHPERVSEDQVKRRVDEIVGTNEGVRRRHAKQTDRDVARAVRNKPAVKMSRKQRRAQRVKPSAAVSLTAQNITRPTVHDLQAYLTELEQVYRHGDLTPREKASNAQLRGQIEQAIKHPQDEALIEQAARAYQQVERPRTEKLVKYRMLDPEEAAKRRELPFAVRQLGATRDTRPRLTDAGVQKMVIGRRIEEAKANFEDPAVIADLVAEGRRVKKATKGQAVKRAPGFVDEHGKPLSAAQIRAERTRGSEDAVTGKVTRTPLPGEPAYVSHAPTLMRPGSFFRDSARPVTVGSKPFTGGSVTKGTFDASPEALHASARRLQSLIDAHEGHLRFLDEFALRDSRGKAVSGSRERLQAAIDKATLDHRGNPRPGSRNYRIVNTQPFGGRTSQLDELLNQLNRHGELHSAAKDETNPVVQALEDALAGKGDGPFVAIPEEAAARIEQHLKVLGSSGGQVWQTINTVWRKNVLAFSPKWATSNVAEATVRSIVAGVRPGDRALLKRTLDEWRKDDPDAAEAFLASLGTGHYGFVERTQRHATAEEFADPARHGPFVRQMARIAGTINRTSVINWVPKAWGAWTSHVMNGMGRIEGQYKIALAGKKLRDTAQQSRAFADLSEKGLREALEGLKGTPTQVEIARFVRTAYGKYEAHSPQMRKWIEMYTPFVAWTLNAARFLTIVLPRDHPVLTAFMADVVNSQEDWLKDEGLWIDEQDTLPTYMLGDIPAGGGLLNVAKYTPASLMQDPILTMGSALLPSMSNLLMASKGLDPFGNPLKGSREGAILRGLLGLAVPGPLAQQAQPGHKSILETLNPVEVIPGNKVEYARVRETIDRLQKRIDGLPESEKTQPYKPAYRALLDELADLQGTRDSLLVQAGFKSDPAMGVRTPLRLIRRQIRDLPDDQRGDEFGFDSKTLSGLKKTEAALSGAVAALAPVPKAKVRKTKPRPDSTRVKVRKSVERLRDRDVRQEVLDEINRLREQAKVDRGG